MLFKKTKQNKNKKNFSCYGNFSKACGYAQWANAQSGTRPLLESTDPMDQWNDKD